MTRRLVFAAPLALCLILTPVVGVAHHDAPAAVATTPAAVEVTEDSFAWDCQTQGNRQCGTYWGEYDGHPACWAVVGDTSYVRCADGFTTTT